MKLRFVRRNVFQQREFDEVAPDVFDAAEPHFLAIAEFVELTRLCAQHTPQMVGSFPFHDGATVVKFLNEEAAAHVDSFWHVQFRNGCTNPKFPWR